MERIILRDISLEKSQLEKLHIFLDDSGNIITLPLLWAIHLALTGCIYKWESRGLFKSYRGRIGYQKAIHTEKLFNMFPALENTIENYIGHFFQFLRYINESHKIHNTPSVHNTELINSSFINEYLNNTLATRLSVELH
ncbi:hypothetical protein GALL_113150 [mine drainage metagenome]|uniref:Uncharacterized protein n=1 Tax=mine drainage metagenome TaxID=410659 RepID=A0A1J5SYN0_9ZZZZ